MNPATFIHHPPIHSFYLSLSALLLHVLGFVASFIPAGSRNVHAGTRRSRSVNDALLRKDKCCSPAASPMNGRGDRSLDVMALLCSVT